MFATVRRYEGIDTSHKDELTKKVGESLAPRLSKLPGFSGYFLIDTGEGVMSSIRPLRHVGAGHRVDSCRIRVGARREAREDPQESAQGHGRRGHRPQDQRSRSGVSPGSTQGGSASAGPFTRTGTFVHSQGTVPGVGPSPSFPRSL